MIYLHNQAQAERHEPVWCWQMPVVKVCLMCQYAEVAGMVVKQIQNMNKASTFLAMLQNVQNFIIKHQQATLFLMVASLCSERREGERD